MPDELWMEVCEIVQETRIKTIPMEKKCKKAKWLSGEALQIAVKRREVKSKGQKERYTHLNTEFQRIARRDKKAFLSNQCREIEEKNRMGKTRDLFKKIRYTKGTLHAKMGSIKDRSGMDLTEVEDIKKRWPSAHGRCFTRPRIPSRFNLQFRLQAAVPVLRPRFASTPGTGMLTRRPSAHPASAGRP